MQMEIALNENPAVAERLSIADLLILTAGAAVGLSYITGATEGMRFINNPDCLADWRVFTLLFYVAMGGMTMAAALLLLKLRLTTGRVWPAATTVLFAIGLLCWCLLPLATNGFALVLEFHGSSPGILGKFYTYDPGACVIEGFLSLWPIASLGLLVACSLTTAAPQWWLLRGAWPDWLGMWSLVAWSAPVVPLLYRIVAFCLSPTETL